MQEKIFTMQQFASYIHLFFMHLLANIVWREKNLIFIFIFRKQLARLFEVLLMVLIILISVLLLHYFKKNILRGPKRFFFCQTVIASNSTS